MPNVRMSAAAAKAKAAKMKADAKKKAAKMKAGSPTKKTGTPKTDYKYKRIEIKSEMPKFKLEKEKKVKMKKKDLKLKKQSPAKNKSELKREVKKTKTSGGSVKNVFKKGDKFASKQTKKTNQKGPKSAKEARLGVVKKKTKQTAKMSGKTGANEGGKYKSKTKFVKDGVKAKSKIKEKVKDGVKSRKEVVKSGGKKIKVKTSSPMKLRKAKKAVKKGMTPDEASRKGLVKNEDYNKLLQSRAYKKQRADEAGYKSVRKAKKAAKANDGFLPEGPAKMKEKSPMNMSGRSYDMKMAYDKKLTPKARLHYLENERHDAPGKMKGSPYQKYGSPYHMGQKDSPMNKELVGKQNNLPEHLKKKIKAAPEMKGSPYHMSNELKYGGPVIDQMKTLSQAGSFKVLKHMKSKI